MIDIFVKEPKPFKDLWAKRLEVAAFGIKLMVIGKKDLMALKRKAGRAKDVFDLEELKKGGLVDYILGAEPSFGVFVLGYSDHPIKQRYMDVYKMGKGPLYTFYVPYHLSPLEAPVSVARAAIFHEASMAPKAGLMTEVITLAKRDLKAGEKLDGIGGFTCYGTIDNYEVSAAKKLLPMGLCDGCILNKDISMDAEITYDDVTLPSGRMADILRAEQNRLYAK
jgi:predicted homoserine dehydrogenase-like protein